MTAAPAVTAAPDTTVTPITAGTPSAPDTANITRLPTSNDYAGFPSPTTAPTHTPTAAPAAPNGQIVPLGRRRSHLGRAPRGRGPKVLAAVLVVALIGGGGFAVWKETHQSSSTAAPHGPAGLVITKVPGSYSRAPDNQANASLNPGPGWVASDTRLWTNDGGQEDVSVSLSQFHTSAQAAADAKLSASLTGTKVGARATAPLSSMRESGSTVVLTRGTYEIVVTAHGPAVTAATEANLVAMAQDNAVAGG